MPRLDDPEIKLKQKKPFIRKSLRPWDDPEDFIPNKTFETTDEESALIKTSDHLSAVEKQITDKQLVNNRETIGNQLVNNKVNNRETIGNQIGLKTTTDESGIQTTGYEQTLSAISRLFGLQKIALFHIVENCKARGLLYTDPITNEFFRTVLNTDIHSVKTTIQRLIKKDLVRRKEAKKGKGGYTIFSISISVRKATIEAIKTLDIDSQKNSLLVESKETIGKQLVNNKVNNKVNNADIVVSSYINTNYRNLDIPESWESIDITPLESIGFDLSHLVQINRAYEKTPNTTLSPELIQTSIYAFAYDLKNNNVEKIFKNPAATVLLSLLKKGQPYNSVTPDKCVSPQQDALNKHNHMLQTQHARELELMQQIKDTEFSLWLEAFPDDELFLLCPENAVPLKATDKLFKTVRKRMAKEKAKDYFDAEIWPTKKQAILATATRGTVTLSQEEKVLTNA